MKLYLNNASPYARLVTVVASEKKLADRIELIWTDPWASREELLAVTPFAKVPVLIAEDGEPLLESTCICDYLDEIGAGPVLVPKAGPERLTGLRKYALARGLIDAAFGVVIQKRYGTSQSVLVERWRVAVDRGIEMLERTLAPAPAPDLGDLAAAVALSYIDFRMPEVAWRPSAPRLEAWFDSVAARPSMMTTAPR